MPKRPRDPNQLGKLIVDIATGVVQDEISERKRNPQLRGRLGARSSVITGNPDESHISTRYVERQNLTLRMMNRRFTRLTNAFSKKIENHMHWIALHFMHYNFCRIHKSLRVTPAMEAGISNHVWSLEDLANLANELIRLFLLRGKKWKIDIKTVLSSHHLFKE